MEQKIYLVITSYGFYENCRENVECAFTNEKEAREYANILDKKHLAEPVFNEEVWNDICVDVDDYFQTNEDEFTNPYNAGTKEWEEWNKEFDVFEREKYLEFAHKNGFTEMTKEDIDRQFEFEKSKYCNYNPTEIKEVTLYNSNAEK